MYRLYFLLLLFLVPNIIFAQWGKKQEYSFLEVSKIDIDGNDTDWDGLLMDVGDGAWSYGICKVGNEVYVAIQVKDQLLLQESLHEGLFVNISYTQKKRDGARIDYPYWDRERKRAFKNLDDYQDVSHYKEKMLEYVSGYLVKGFSRVRDGILAIDNDYGIKANVSFIDNKVLFYEVKIPVALIDLQTDKVSIQVGVNTGYSQLKRLSKHSTSGRNVYGRGALYMKNRLKNPFSFPTDVWVTGTIKN